MNIIYSDRDLAVIIKPVGMDSEHQVPADIFGMMLCNAPLKHFLGALTLLE